MSKNCMHCSQRKGRRYYVLDDNNRIHLLHCCDKCKGSYPALSSAAKTHKEAYLEQITNALM